MIQVEEDWWTDEGWTNYIKGTKAALAQLLKKPPDYYGVLKPDSISNAVLTHVEALRDELIAWCEAAT
jgi:hypothetical protein